VSAIASLRSDLAAGTGGSGQRSDLTAGLPDTGADED